MAAPVLLPRSYLGDRAQGAHRGTPASRAALLRTVGWPAVPPLAVIPRPGLPASAVAGRRVPYRHEFDGKTRSAGSHHPDYLSGNGAGTPCAEPDKRRSTPMTTTAA